MRLRAALVVTVLLGTAVVTSSAAGDHVNAAQGKGPPHCSGSPATVRATCPGPVVTGFFPTHGPSTGGTVVTLLGSDFARCGGVQHVLFDGIDATTVAVQSDTILTAVAPAHPTVGFASVIVQTHCGTSYPILFTYTG